MKLNGLASEMVYEVQLHKSYSQFKIFDIAIREYIAKVGPGSHKDALGCFLRHAKIIKLARIFYKELVGAVSILAVAGSFSL
jgi:hypothetical protein